MCSPVRALVCSLPPLPLPSPPPSHFYFGFGDDFDSEETKNTHFFTLEEIKALICEDVHEKMQNMRMLRKFPAKSRKTVKKIV